MNLWQTSSALKSKKNFSTYVDEKQRGMLVSEFKSEANDTVRICCFCPENIETNVLINKYVGCNTLEKSKSHLEELLNELLKREF